MNLKQDIYTFRPHVKFVCRLPIFEICFSLFLYLIFSLKTQLAIINCFIRWPSRSSYNIIYKLQELWDQENQLAAKDVTLNSEI